MSDSTNRGIVSCYNNSIEALTCVFVIKRVVDLYYDNLEKL